MLCDPFSARKGGFDMAWFGKGVPSALGCREVPSNKTEGSQSWTDCVGVVRWTEWKAVCLRWRDRQPERGWEVRGDITSSRVWKKFTVARTCPEEQKRQGCGHRFVAGYADGLVHYPRDDEKITKGFKWGQDMTNLVGFKWSLWLWCGDQIWKGQHGSRETI